MTSHHSRRYANLSFLLALLLLTTASVFSQTTTARPDRKTRPNGSYSISDNENIGLQMATSTWQFRPRRAWTTANNYNLGVANDSGVCGLYRVALAIHSRRIR